MRTRQLSDSKQAPVYFSPRSDAARERRVPPANVSDWISARIKDMESKEIASDSMEDIERDISRMMARLEEAGSGAW